NDLVDAERREIERGFDDPPVERHALVDADAREYGRNILVVSDAPLVERGRALNLARGQSGTQEGRSIRDRSTEQVAQRPRGVRAVQRRRPVLREHQRRRRRTRRLADAALAGEPEDLPGWMY